MKASMSGLLPRIVVPVASVLILSLGLLTWQIRSHSVSALSEVADRELAAIAGYYGNQIKIFLITALEDATSVAKILSDSLEHKAFKREELASIHRGVTESRKSTLASGSIWEKNAYDGRDADFKGTPGSDDTGRFSPFFVANNREMQAVVNYEQQQFYTEPLKRQRAFITDPFDYDFPGRGILRCITATAPIKVNNVYKGMTFCTVTLETINKIIADIKVYSSGYGFLITEEGIIISYPDKSALGKKLFEVRQSGNKEALQAAMQSGANYLDRREDPKLGEVVDYYYPISLRETGQIWYFVISVPTDEVLEKAAFIGKLSIALSLGAIVLTLLLVVLVVRSSVKPISYLSGVAHKIAQGDLDIPIDVQKFKGEILELGVAFKQMVSSLRESLSNAEAMGKDAREQTEKAEDAMQEAKKAGEEALETSRRILGIAAELENVVNVVSSAANQLQAQIRQAEQGATEQAGRVAETVTSMETMNDMVTQVANNACDAADVAEQARERAEEGAHIVQQAMASILDVQRYSVELKSDMAALNEQTQAISTIMGVISDIADQTNLLALNAAIEAARAGEAGRGFAVVADEVRKLAEKTMASTSEVGSAIRTIQQGVNKSVQQVEETVKSIELATSLSSNSGDALTAIVTMVENAAKQARTIASASEEQSSSSREVARGMEQVHTIAKTTEEGMVEAVRAVHELLQQAKILSELVASMRQTS